MNARWAALTDRQKSAILDKHRDWNVDDDWWDYVYEHFIEDMNAVGIEVDTTSERTANGRRTPPHPCIWFSGFCSQGDGAYFEGRVSDFRLFAPLVGPKYVRLFSGQEIIDATSLQWAGEAMRVEATLDLIENPYDREENPLRWHARESLGQELSKLWDEFEGDAQQKINDYASKLYADLEKEYEHLTSDEAVLESLEANDMLDEKIDKILEMEEA